MRRIKLLLSNNSGSSIALVGVAMLMLLTVAGLVLDGGTVFLEKIKMQKVADDAVLSGAQELTTDEVTVENIVHSVLTNRQMNQNVSALSVNVDKKINLDLTKTVPLAFSKLFGKNAVTLHVHSAASLEVMGRAVGAAPLGMDDSTALEFGKAYSLKVGPGDSVAGNFGILALAGNGAKTYYETLMSGYQQELKVGDIIPTQTGNIAGFTREAVQEKLNQCPYTADAYKDPNCSAVILIPLYMPYESSTNQLKSVKITGFAYFWIQAPMDSKDTSITGVFIKRIGKGYTEASSLDRGAYVVKLTE